MAKRHSIVVATTIALILLLAACGNSPTDTAGGSQSGGGGGGGATVAPASTVSKADLQKKVPVDAPGVTDTEIRVGGVASGTNILQADYNQVFNGTQAYFDKINSEGGIYGRKLVLAAKRDDRMVGNSDEMQGLISQDNVFAILPVATVLFTGAKTAADAKVPTFGWNINDEWRGSPYLFGEKGSVICADCGNPSQPWLVKKLGKSKIGVLSYGSQPQSKQCSDGIHKAFDRWPTGKIVYEDDSITFGATDLSVPVSKMKDAGVDYVTTCMDTNAAITLGKEMHKQGLTAPQQLPNGYEYDLLNNFGDVMEGDIVTVQFTPFEVSDPPPALKDYFTWIDKTPGAKRGELSLAGWTDAEMFVEGLKMAGPEFTRDKIINSLNTLKHWNADGINSGVDWTIEHDNVSGEVCFAHVKVENKKFVPQFGEPGKPFVCIPNDVKDLPDNPTLRS